MTRVVTARKLARRSKKGKEYGRLRRRGRGRRLLLLLLLLPNEGDSRSMAKKVRGTAVERIAQVLRQPLVYVEGVGEWVCSGARHVPPCASAAKLPLCADSYSATHVDTLRVPQEEEVPVTETNTCRTAPLHPTPYSTHHHGRYSVCHGPAGHRRTVVTPRPILFRIAEAVPPPSAPAYRAPRLLPPFGLFPRHNILNQRRRVR